MGLMFSTRVTFSSRFMCAMLGSEGAVSKTVFSVVIWLWLCYDAVL